MAGRKPAGFTWIVKTFCFRKFRDICLKVKRLRLMLTISIALFTLLFMSANLNNPTLLPVPLRFAPKCINLVSPESNLPTNVPRYEYPQPIIRDYSHFNDHSWMPRFNTMEVHQRTIELLKSIGDLFQKHDVTYTLYHGTLLGSFMFHDLIPWDDDLDIIVSFEAINRVRAIFRDPAVKAEFGVTSYRDAIDIYAEPYIDLDVNPDDPNFCGNHPDLIGLKCGHKFHVFRQDSPKTLRRQLGYPFIDVKFYTENSTHVIPILTQSEPEFDDFVYEKKDFYPLHFRPFFNLWQPVPRKARALLQMKFRQFECKSKWYSHQTQTISMGYGSSCLVTKDCYPYVKRLPFYSESGTIHGVIEQLVIGETVIYEAIVDEEYSELLPYNL